MRGDFKIMNCKEARALFSEYYDRELNEEVRHAVNEHLSDCLECRAEYKNFRKSIKILRKLKTLDVPQNYLKKPKKSKQIPASRCWFD
jgi:predicted anti-sigma-YlaC factor YlaD